MVVIRANAGLEYGFGDRQDYSFSPYCVAIDIKAFERLASRTLNFIDRKGLKEPKRTVYFYQHPMGIIKKEELDGHLYVSDVDIPERIVKSSKNARRRYWSKICKDLQYGISKELGAIPIDKNFIVDIDVNEDHTVALVGTMTRGSKLYEELSNMGTPFLINFFESCAGCSPSSDASSVKNDDSIFALPLTEFFFRSNLTSGNLRSGYTNFVLNAVRNPTEEAYAGFVYYRNVDNKVELPNVIAIVDSKPTSKTFNELSDWGKKCSDKWHEVADLERKVFGEIPSEGFTISMVHLRDSTDELKDMMEYLIETSQIGFISKEQPVFDPYISKLKRAHDKKPRTFLEYMKSFGEYLELRERYPESRLPAKSYPLKEVISFMERLKYDDSRTHEQKMKLFRQMLEELSKSLGDLEKYMNENNKKD